ncbi:Crp/Fnr family transcriptional regulator [Aureispira sp. CCB-QB1]|uniref:Crp/Fnr family transcriptional regulator n=1 Tax=Aureispira sp. CCB-QB1 TaxID=1313421 RepID=UPI000698BB9C|nr:Crp/Fnr family transcriptional regulator [Aureispira sp. CCB-QB1]
MKEKIIEYMAQFEFFTTTEMEEIAAQLHIEAFPKGTLLLKEGEIADKCFFVLEGCIRQYYLVDGEEKTTAFYTEKQAAVSFTSYAEQSPSTHYLVCVEDCILLVGNPTQEQAMYQQHPKLEAFIRLLLEQGFGKTQEQFANFISSSPEKRYCDLLKNQPDLLHRVPQHQIASYLGVTPESLSRIRKRVASKK